MQNQQFTKKERRALSSLYLSAGLKKRIRDHLIENGDTEIKGGNAWFPIIVILALNAYPIALVIEWVLHMSLSSVLTEVMIGLFLVARLIELVVNAHDWGLHEAKKNTFFVTLRSIHNIHQKGTTGGKIIIFLSFMVPILILVTAKEWSLIPVLLIGFVVKWESDKQFIRCFTRAVHRMG